MKKLATLLFLTLFSTVAIGQSKEKIKGSRNVTTEYKTIGNFNSLEITDNLIVNLELGEIAGIKIEADDNLHDVISINANGGKLQLTTNKDVSRFKKMNVRITYTNALRNITSKGESEVNVIQEIIVDTLHVKSYDKSKIFMNAKVSEFSLEADDKSKIELNLKATKSKIVLTKDSNLKSLLTSTDLTCDLYQNATAKIEGDVTDGVIRLDNEAELTADKLNIKNITVMTEASSKALINAVNKITIDASNKSEIQLYGNAKIDLRTLTEEAKLLKKIK